METLYPTYKFTEDDAKNQLARFVRLGHPSNYPFDNFHAHEYSEILVFITGGGNHNINFKDHKVENNSIHLIAARDLHRLERPVSSTGFAIVYKDQLLPKLQMVNPDIDFYAVFAYSRVINLDDEQARNFGFLFRELLNNEKEAAYLLQIIAAFITRVAMLTQLSDTTEKNYDPILSEVLNLIEKHYKTSKTVSEYAALLNVSIRTLHNRIKKASGMTMTEMLQDRILKEAKKLLIISKMNVSEIALDLGFNEAAHFTHWFKKQTGILPTEYKHGN